MSSYFDNLRDEEYRPSRGSRSRSRSRTRARDDDDEDEEDLDESYDRFSDEPDTRDSSYGRRRTGPQQSSGGRRSGTAATTSSNNKKKKKSSKSSQPHHHNHESSGDDHDYTSSTTSQMSYSRSSSSNANARNDIYAAYAKNKEKKNDLFEAYRKLKTTPRSSTTTTSTSSTTRRSSGQDEDNSNPSNPHSSQTPATSTSTQMSTTEDEEHSHLHHSGGTSLSGRRASAQSSKSNNNNKGSTKKAKQQQQQPIAPDLGSPEFPPPNKKTTTTTTATGTTKPKRKTIKKKPNNANALSSASNHSARPGGKSPSPVLQRDDHTLQSSVLQSSQESPTSNTKTSSKKGTSTTTKKKKVKPKQQQQQTKNQQQQQEAKPTHYVTVTDYESPKKQSKQQQQLTSTTTPQPSVPPPQIYAARMQDESQTSYPSKIPPHPRVGVMEDESSRNTGPVVPPHPPVGVVHRNPSPLPGEMPPHPPIGVRRQVTPPPKHPPVGINKYSPKNKNKANHPPINIRFADKTQRIPSHSPVGVSFQEQAPPRGNPAHRGPQDSMSSMEEEDDELASLDPRSFQLKNSLDRKSLKDVAHYSRRIDVVRENLRRNITIDESAQGHNKDGKKKRKKKKKDKKGDGDDDDSSSSGSSKSSKGGIMAFLSGFKGHPKPGHVDRRELTEQERRNRDNPFLNRPTGIKMSHTVGLNKKNKHKHTSMHDIHSDIDGSSRGDLSGSYRPGGSGASYGTHSLDGSSSGYSSYEKTMQEKYCPLPAPVKGVQQFCGRIVTNTNFQVFMIFLIMLNALVLGIATYDFPNPRVEVVLERIDKVLLVIFTIELALQFGYCGYTLFLDGWLVFDTLTVVTSWWLEGVQVFRSFRIFRSFRLIVRLPLLKNLVLTVFHVMPRIYSILGLLLLILYVYGVLCTILFGDMWALGQTDKNYFSRLDYSVFTLFQMVTLEGWGDVVRQVRAVHSSIATMIFSTFVIFTGFIMYNLIVAVMCDSMLVIEAQGREEIRQQQQEKKRLAEAAKEEEEKRIIDEMLRQRKEDGVRRKRLKGLVGEDSTVSYHESTTRHSEHDEPSWEHMSDGFMDEEEDEEEIIEYREVFCEHCEGCFEIPKYPPSVRRRNMERDEIMAKNQERVRNLQVKVAQMAETQQRVTAVLQTLMHEIEASRMRAMNNNSSSYHGGSLGDNSIGESNEEDRVRLGKLQ